MLPQQSPRKLTDHDDWNENEFSDEQIKRLLQKAERRLHGNAGLTTYNTEAVALQDATQLDPKPIAQPYITSINGVARADPRRLLKDEDRRLANSATPIGDPLTVREKAAKLRSQTSGSHFNLPRANLDSTLKADVSLLKLRGVLDPKQHYKKESSKSLVSEFSEVGRIIEGPLEYNTRLPNRERKRTFIEEVLANESSMGRFKDRYNEIQSSKTSGKRAYYDKLKSKRLRGIRKS